ncbi:MAG: hypothetical protein EXR39_06560 [Betaproteobacteria bacterium]|nr:hypothetical protein [Betaproteobacteria bacterium]
MNKILAAVILTGMIAAVPASAHAHDRRSDSHHQIDDDSRYYDARHHRDHRHRQYRVYDAPVVYYPAPRVAQIYVPALPLPPLPLPHVNIMWRIGH